MKQLLTLLLAVPLFYSCKKEQLSDIAPAAMSSINTMEASKRVDCEPFPFGVLALKNGNSSTVNMNMTGDIGLSENVSSPLINNLLLNGNLVVHTGIVNLLFSLSPLAPAILPQSSQDGDWKLQAANENAALLTSRYTALSATINYNNLSANTTITTSPTTDKPNTIVNVNSVNMNGKILTLVGRTSSDDGFIINVSGSFSFSNNAEIKLVNVRPERVLFNVSGAVTAYVKSGVKFKGTILANSGTVSYENPAMYEGSIIAKNINASASLLSVGNTTFIQKTYCNGYQWEGDGECVPTTGETNLMAGQTIIAGTVRVSNDGENLTVTYSTSNGWKITDIHLYIGALENVPTANGNPIPGQFPIHATFSPAVSTYTYTRPLAGLPDCFYVAAHAVVKKGNQTETGWGQGQDFVGNNWGMFFSYCQQDCP